MVVLYRGHKLYLRMRSKHQAVNSERHIFAGTNYTFIYLLSSYDSTPEDYNFCGVSKTT